jgi:addiction module RelE/StbE family toxin
VKLVFDERALTDLDNIFRWIAQDSPATARTVVDRIFESVEQLAIYPQMGRAGVVEGTREWVVPRLPYIAVYEVGTLRDEVVVIAIFHGAQGRQGET